MLSELQWFALQDAVRSLGQLRYYLCNIYLEGEYLFLEVKSCDAEEQNHLFIIDYEGDLL
mgnify:CR=1 FL=1